MPPRIATSNVGFEAHRGVGASISTFCASLSLLRRTISLLLSCCACTVHRQSLPNLLLLKLIFLQKPVRRPPFLPVFACYQGVSGRIRAPSPSPTRA